MEIVDELEVDRRGIYAGAIGYISAAGEMDSCIALRTAVIKNNKMHVQAGAGIVYDSVEQSEFEECQNKARALLRAARDAINLTKMGDMSLNGINFALIQTHLALLRKAQATVMFLYIGNYL